MPGQMSRQERQELLKSLSPAMQLSEAKDYSELYDGLCACVEDMMKRERDGGYDIASDSAFVLGLVLGKLRSLKEKY